MARKEPYNEKDINQLKIAIFSKKRDELSDKYSKSLRDLVDQCLNTDPESRPTVVNLLKHPLVKTELGKILNDFLPLTYNYATAMRAHLVLEQVIDFKCMLHKKTEYGLEVTDSTVLRIANRSYYT